MENKIQKLADIIKNSKYLVFFTGAGVSTDSGLKSFRGKDGLYSTLYKGKYRPEEVLSSDFFYSHRNIFMEYVENELNINGIKPNKGHLALAELEKIGVLKAVITQNIDDYAGGNKYVNGIFFHTLRRNDSFFWGGTCDRDRRERGNISPSA